MIIVPHENLIQIADITRNGCDIFGIEDVPKSENECWKVYEKIKTGNLPDVPRGSFFEITA